MPFSIIITLKESNIEDRNLTISTATKSTAQAVADSLKQSENVYSILMIKDITL